MDRSLVLASTSPRRRMLLTEAGIDFSVKAPMLAEERLNPDCELAEALEALALAKARSVAEKMPQALVMGADTIVCKDGMVLGKPADAEEAARMLRMLSGEKHEVITAVALCCDETGAAATGHAVSEVCFKALSEEDIQAYIESGEPLDKAGAYGIQGEGGKFVQALEGDYDNVVGLPMKLVKEMLSQWEANQ